MVDSSRGGGRKPKVEKTFNPPDKIDNNNYVHYYNLRLLDDYRTCDVATDSDWFRLRWCPPTDHSRPRWARTKITNSLYGCLCRDMPVGAAHPGVTRLRRLPCGLPSPGSRGGRFVQLSALQCKRENPSERRAEPDSRTPTRLSSVPSGWRSARGCPVLAT